MRFTACFLLMIVCVGIANAQQPNCPRIEVTGPSGVTNPGETMTFAVTLSSTPENIKYDWKVSRGVIEIGQATQSIVVRTSREDQGTSVEATVVVAGFPVECKSTASESGPVAYIPVCNCASDEFGKLKPNEIRSRLDNFFQELLNNPSSIGVAVFRVINRNQIGRENRYLKLFVKHAKFREFDLSRFQFKFEEGDSIQTRLYRFPESVPIICPECVTIYGRDLK